ncbi:polysaccharide deacetylase family protein [Metabacillus herbersteinensis]|uniref:Polysaccharide deacetylase family protein n=1 Tax=Metabacillus herbersteinensis TaxID=283816 RepID=A0ABV6GLU4_9BACI
MEFFRIAAILLAFISLCSGCNVQTASNQEKQNGENKERIAEDSDQNKQEFESENDNKEIVEKQDDIELKEVVTEAVVSLQPTYELNAANWSIKPISGETNKKVVLLTIDDAPDRYSLKMAKTLKAAGVSAIFFVNGHFIQSDEKKAILKEIYDMGFAIGNHTMTHSNLNDLSEEEQFKEIVELNNQIELIIGERPRFYRAPFGSNTEYSKELAEKEGMLLMNWTYGYDWEKDYLSKDALTDIMVNTPYLTDGANLLMHDREWTYEALRGIVKGLQEKGYTIVDPNLIKTPK